MINLNNRPCEYFEGMTVKKLIEKYKYSYPVLTVRINGIYIEESDYETSFILDGDRVEIIHPIAGG